MKRQPVIRRPEVFADLISYRWQVKYRWEDPQLSRNGSLLQERKKGTQWPDTKISHWLVRRICDVLVMQSIRCCPSIVLQNFKLK